MQAAWDQDGPDAFEWAVLWEMPKTWTHPAAHHLYTAAEICFIYERQPVYNARRHRAESRYVASKIYVAKMGGWIGDADA